MSKKNGNKNGDGEMEYPEFKVIKSGQLLVENIKKVLETIIDIWSLPPIKVTIMIADLGGGKGQVIFDKNYNFILKIDQSYIPYTEEKREDLHITVLHEVFHIVAYNFELTLDKVMELLEDENNTLQILFMFYEQFIEKLAWIYYNASGIRKIFWAVGL